MNETYLTGKNIELIYSLWDSQDSIKESTVRHCLGACQLSNAPVQVDAQRSDIIRGANELVLLSYNWY